MKIAMIGLGRMGANMVRRLVRDDHDLVVFDQVEEVSSRLSDEDENIRSAATLQEVIQNLESPRVIWLMVPHQFVDDTIEKLLAAGLSAGDVLVDGGNSNYKKSQARASQLKTQKIHFVDSGTSGGIWGLKEGYSLMLGGSEEAVSLLKPALQSLAPSADSGWGHVGPAGAGHYVKMIHNGIEYGMMQAFAEGFDLMQNKDEMQLDISQISRIWQHGSVVRSWLLDLISDALEQDVTLNDLSDYVDDSGEGRWTVEDSIEQAIPAPVLTLALQMRFQSRQHPSYAGKVLNAMRAGFGGHSIKPADDN